MLFASTKAIMNNSKCSKYSFEISFLQMKIDKFVH